MRVCSRYFASFGGRRFGASAIQCCYAETEIAELSVTLDFLCKVKAKTAMAKRKKVGLDVKMSRNVSRL